MITHSDYCPVGNTGPLEECPPCQAEFEEKRDYYRRLYAAESHYDREELAQAYSHPSERYKLISLTREN